jgi:WD40 repeat protein
MMRFLRTRLKFVLIFACFFCAWEASAQTTFLGHELSWVGSDTLYEALDGRPKFKVKVVNRSGSVTPDRVGVSFSSPDYSSPGGGFANFPNGGFIKLAPGDSMIVSVWSSGVFEHPREDKDANGAFVREIGMRFLKDVFMNEESTYLSRRMTFIEWPRPLTLERVSGPMQVAVQIPSVAPSQVANESPEVIVGLRTPDSEIIQITRRPAGAAFVLDLSLLPRTDWHIVVDAPGHLRSVTRLDPSSSDTVQVRLRPVTTEIPRFQLKKVIETPTGFWRGAVSESERTAVFFPGQENFVQFATPAEAAAIRKSSMVYKTTFTGEVLWTHEADWEMWGGDMTPDGRWVVYVENPSFVMGARDRHRMVVLDGLTGEVYWDLVEEPFTPMGRRLESLSVKLSPDGSLIAVGTSASGRVSLFDRERRELVWERPDDQGVGQVREMLFSADGAFLYVGSGDSYLRKLKIEDGEVVWKAFIGGWPFVNGLTLSADGKHIYTGTKSKDLTKVDEATGEIVWQQEVSNFDAAESADGRYVATFGGRIVNAEDGTYVGTAADRAVFLEEGDFLIGIDRAVTTYDLGGRQWAQSQMSGINECGGCQVQWAYISKDRQHVMAAARDMTDPSRIPGPGIAFYTRMPGNTVAIEDEAIIGGPTHELMPIFPNPFNPSTTIPFRLQYGVDVRLAAFDVLGRRVALFIQEWLPAGFHTAQFNADGLASGTYLIRMEAGDFVATQQVVLLK